MKEPNEKDDFFELLRLAYVAASEAAESVVDETELVHGLSLQELEKGDANLTIQKNGPIHNLFKQYTINNRTDYAKIYEKNDQLILKIFYNFHNRKKKEIITAAFNAIKYVLSSLENIQISTF